MDLFSFSSVAPHAKVFRSQDFVKAWLTQEETSRLPISQSLTAIGPAGWFGRTCPAFCRLTADGILEPLSGAWSNAGMASPGECLTLNTCEWTAWNGPSRNDDGVSSLSDVLETGELPQRFYLSANACLGVLRRADKRSKSLPPALNAALQAVASQT